MIVHAVFASLIVNGEVRSIRRFEAVTMHSVTLPPDINAAHRSRASGTAVESFSARAQAGRIRNRHSISTYLMHLSNQIVSDIYPIRCTMEPRNTPNTSLKR